MPIRSLSQPLNILKIASALSDSPPIRPMIVVAAPSTLDKKRGIRVKIISLETSVRKLTIPKKNTLGLSPQILLPLVSVFNGLINYFSSITSVTSSLIFLLDCSSTSLPSAVA
ncbi:hypothetical protein ES703_43492 [subsurface metagenome]